MTRTDPARSYAPGASPPAAGGAVLALLGAPSALGIGAPAVLLPEIGHDLGVPAATATWLVTAFGWGIAVGTPLGGGLVRHRGIRAALLACSVVVLAGAATVLGAPTVAVAALGAALQGLGAAGLTATAMALARTSRTMGAVTAAQAALGATGPLVGTLVAQVLTWRAALVLPVLALLAVSAVVRAAGAAPAPGGAGLDLRGALLLALGVSALVALPHRPLEAVVVAVVAGAALALHIARRPAGFVPRAVATQPRFLVAAATALTIAVANFGIFYAAPTLIGRATGWSATQAGAVMLWPFLLGGALSWLVVAGVARFGLATVAGALLATTTAAALIVAFVPLLPVLLVAMAAGSLAASSGNGALAVRAGAAVPEPDRPAAIGLFNLWYLLGAAFGPALVAILLAP